MLPDNGSGIPPKQTSGCPNVGRSEAYDDYATTNDDDNRLVLEHSFVKKVLHPKSSDEKKGFCLSHDQMFHFQEEEGEGQQGDLHL